MALFSIFKWLFTNRTRWAEIARYVCGCACGLGLKVVVSGIATAYGASIALAYLIGQVVVLFEAFFFHSLITFHKRFSSWRDFFQDLIKYTSATAAIKLFDYFLVVVLCSALRAKMIGNADGWMLQIFNALTITVVSIVIFLLRYLLYRKIFISVGVEKYTGKIRSAFVVHTTDREIAENAASGGFCTSILAGMLSRKEIDGALVSMLDWSGDDPPSARGVIVRDRESLLAAQGSIYFDFPLLSADIMRQLREFQGKLAVVALPCQAAALKKICDREPKLAAKIVLVIGLFCGHATKRELILRVLEKKGISPREIVAFRFRRGRWRGKMWVKLADGREYYWPTATYNLYQNLFVHCATRCLSCCDHFAEAADISCGDIWQLKYRNAQVKPSMVAVRTEQGEKAFEAAEQSGDIYATQQTAEALFKSNSRSVIFHKAVAARKKVFAGYGKEITVSPDAPRARWNELLAARIIVKYWANPDKALATSRKILKFWLYVFKGLTSF